MQYKRRNVKVFREFPKGCGVICKNSNVGKSLMPSKFKEEIVLEAHGDLPHITKALSNHWETETTDKWVLESDEGFEDHQEEEILRESEYKRNQRSPVEKIRMSLHNSTMEVGTDVVNTAKGVVVSGLAAHSKSPWSQPNNRGSRQVKRKLEL